MVSHRVPSSFHNQTARRSIPLCHKQGAIGRRGRKVANLATFWTASLRTPTQNQVANLGTSAIIVIWIISTDCFPELVMSANGPQRRCASRQDCALKERLRV
jgi:hypothetical protein